MHLYADGMRKNAAWCAAKARDDDLRPALMQEDDGTRLRNSAAMWAQNKITQKRTMHDDVQLS
jgi:hypothetical protein